MVQKRIPQLTIRLNGQSQGVAPEPTQQPPRLTIRINGRVHTVTPLSRTVKEIIEFPQSDDDDMPEADMNDGDGDDQEHGILLEEVDRYISNSQETDMLDAPDWMVEEGEINTNDPDYVFCPAAHCRQLLHLFTKHFCQHPIFPQRLNDGTWSSSQICRNAVWEMYQFCLQRGLREVWGYMWANWYSPKKWHLWARSTSDHLSRLRTTMSVENFWKQLKHDHLHYHVHPPP